MTLGILVLSTGAQTLVVDKKTATERMVALKIL